VDFGTDGSLYVSDWVEGWDRTGKGRIYRVADPSKAEDPAVRELPKLLAEDFETLPVPELVSRLGHADYRIRLRAQLALDSQSRRDEPTGDEARAALSATAEAGSSLDARRHAIWGLGMALTRSAVSPDQLCKLLEDRDPEIRAQTARVLGWGSRTDEHQMILAALVRRLEDESPRVAFHAALSLGKLRATGSGPALARMLEANTDRDPYLRHAGVMGLVGTATDDELKALAAHRSFSVRLGSLLAMRRRLLPEVARFLADPEPKLVAEAARAIHDVPIERAMGELADLGRRPELKDEAVLRRVVGACSRVDTEESAAILAEIAAEPAKPRSIRVEALEVLGQWAKPSGRDLVTGLWRPIPERKPDAAARALAPKIEGLLSEPSENLVRAGIAAAANLHLKEAGKALGALVTTRGRIESTRAEALAAAVALEPPELLATLRAALKSDASGVRAEALRLMAARAPEEALVTIEQVLENGTVAEKQAAFTTLGDLHAAGSDGVLALWMDRLHAGRLQPELELDLLDAARSRKDQEIQGKLDRHEKSRPAGDSLVPYREVLVGGNFARGRRIFFEKAEVYCLRCHKVGGQGGEVGPELTGIARKKDRSYLLRSLVQPNHEIAEGFETLVVATSDGQIQAGVVKGEDDRVIRLMTPEAKLVEIAKDQVEETKRGASAMPEDLVSKLSRKELRDLLEYLGRLR
jgi:quinoprotein glucose dehydrogenase